MIVATNPRTELSEFYPPPYNFLAPRQKLYSRGMGQAVQEAAGTGASIAGSTGALLAAAGVSNVVPVVGQIVGGALAITAVIASMFHGCGQTCTLTSQQANNVGNLMTQNLQQYLALHPSATLQQEALNNFDQLWQALVNYCQQPSMAAAGQRCISDRQQGSCAYKTSPGGWQKDSSGKWNYAYPGANHSGTTCWNYFVGFRDPIANDPRIAELSPPQATANTTAAYAGGGTPASGFNFQSLLIPAALIGGGILVAAMVR